MNKIKYKVIMPAEKIILYLSISALTFIIGLLGAIFFGTYQFLMLLGRAQKQIMTLQAQLVDSAKVVVSLQSDLAKQKQSLHCKKCNCSIQSETTYQSVET